MGIQPATGVLPPTRSLISPVTGYVPQISLALPTQAGRLHVVEVGANDILEASTVYWTSQMGLSTGGLDPMTVVEWAVDGIQSQLQRLLETVPNACNTFVLGVIDIAQLPRIQLLDQAYPNLDFSSTVTDLSHSLNQQVQSVVENLQPAFDQKCLHDSNDDDDDDMAVFGIRFVDTETLYANVLEHPELQDKRTDAPCNQAYVTTQSTCLSSLAARLAFPYYPLPPNTHPHDPDDPPVFCIVPVVPTETCDCDDFVYFDALHPTTQVARLIAETISHHVLEPLCAAAD